MLVYAWLSALPITFFLLSCVFLCFRIIGVTGHPIYHGGTCFRLAMDLALDASNAGMWHILQAFLICHSPAHFPAPTWMTSWHADLTRVC